MTGIRANEVSSNTFESPRTGVKESTTMDKRLVLFRWWVAFTLLMGLVGSAGMVRAAAPSVTRLDDVRMSQLATVDVCILATGQIGHVSRLQLLGDVTGILFGDVDDEACAPEDPGAGEPAGASGNG